MLLSSRRTLAGFSLVETVVLIVVVSLAVPPVAVLLGQTLDSTAEGHMTTMALALGKGLMEEVLSRPFEDPEFGAGSFGTEEGSRSLYDDVDDYDNLNEKPPRDSQDGVLSNYSAFRTRVTVENVAAAAPGGGAMPDGSTEFKRVSVTVLWNTDQKLVRLIGLSSNFSTEGYPPQSGLTFIERPWPSPSNDVDFRVRNDTGDDVYLTHVKATWAGTTAYYTSIDVLVEGHTNYKDVWHCMSHNFIRVGSGNATMFNLGDVVRIPAGDTMRVRLDKCRSSKQWPWGGNVNMRGVPITVELWAAPYTYVPFYMDALE